MTGIVGLGLPVVGTALGWAAHLGWVLPWDGRRSLRATIDVIAKDIEADEQRQHLPAHAQSVQLFVAVLRLVAETPDGWRARLGEELPFVDGSPVPLSAVERARLDRYTGRLEVALVRYGRRVRFSGARVARDVAGVVFDPRSYWNAIDLTGPVVDLDRTSGCGPWRGSSSGPRRRTADGARPRPRRPGRDHVDAVGTEPIRRKLAQVLRVNAFWFRCPATRTALSPVN
jgi:hypothetical protein